MHRITDYLMDAIKKDFSVLLLGAYGIGKSATVYELAKKLAQEYNRQLKLWHELTKEEKEKLLKNPELRKKYFILVDLKGSYLSPENLIVAIPDKEKGVTFDVPMWAKILSKPEAAGLVFLDEINMLPQRLQSVLFELVLQKKIGEYKLNKDVYVMAAGNPTDYNEAADIIPSPLINRFLKVIFDEHITPEYIIQVLKEKDVDERVIAYILFRKQIFSKAKEPFSQSTTPRSLEFLGRAIKGEKDIEKIAFYARGFLREDDAIEFVEFVKNYEALKNIEEYIKDPSKIFLLPSEDTKAILIIRIINRLVTEGKFSELKQFMEKLINAPNITAKEYAVMAYKLVKMLDLQTAVKLISESPVVARFTRQTI